MLSTKDKVVIYSKPWCPYCVRAKALLEKYGFNDIKEIDIELNEEMRDFMIDKTGRTSVPQIFIGERHIGGFDDLSLIIQQEEIL
jgi:glutaredoxin 3